jgi:hypothetical protein
MYNLRRFSTQIRTRSYVASISAGVEVEVPHPNQVLLAHFDDADGTLTFVDSAGRHTVDVETALAFDPEIDTAQSKFGGSAILFTRTGAFPNWSAIKTDGGATNSDWTFGTGDYSIDFWIRFASITSGDDILQFTGHFYMEITASSTIRVHDLTVGPLWESSTVVTTGVWYHIAFTRASGTSRLFINGVEEDSDGSSADMTGASAPSIGGRNEGFDGWIDELRVLKGAAAWTANFTPPTSPYMPYDTDPDVMAWMSKVGLNGGTVSVTRQALVHDLIAGLKADGIWTKLDRLWLLAAENAASALVDLKAGALATAVNSPTFTVDVGYTGEDVFDPVTKYIDTGFILATDGNFAQDDAHISAWCVGNVAASNGGCLVGADQGTGHTQLFVTFTDGNVYGRVNASNGSSGAPGTRAGHWLASRDNSSDRDLYHDGAFVDTVSVSSQSPVATYPVYVLCYNEAGSKKGNAKPNCCVQHRDKYDVRRGGRIL